MPLMRGGSESSSSSRESENPFTERGFLASAGVVGLVVLAGVVTLLSGPPSSTGEPTATGRTTPGTAATTRAGSATSVAAALQADGTCAPPALQGTEVPVSQPADTRWQPLDGFMLPRSATVGPAVINGDIARCYARTPTGAVFAALNGSRRYQRTTDWGAAAQHLLAPGPGRDVYMQQRATASGPNARPQQVLSGENAPQPRGFRILEHNLDRVRVVLVSKPFEGGPVTYATWTVRWIDGDWRVEVPTSGSPPTSAPMNPDDPYVAWDSASMLNPTDGQSEVPR